MPIRLICCWCALTGMLLGGSPAPGASIDPDIAIESLAQAYSSVPLEERIDVRVTIGESSREESISVQMLPDGNYAVHLGDIQLWTQGDQFLAVHRLNAGTYFAAQRPDGRAQWGVLESVLPPLLTPQLALVHGLERGFGAPIGYTRKVVWKSCETDESVQPAVVRLKGEEEGATIDVIADQNLTRILRVIVRMEQRRTRIDLTFTRQPPGLEASVLGVDLAGRTRVESISDLAPVVGDLKIGSVLPDLVLQTTDTSRVEHLAGPCVLALFRNNAEHPLLWLGAAQRFATERAAGVAIPIVVFTLGEAAREFNEKLDAWSLALAPDPVRYSVSPGTTIDRFAPGKPGVLVVVDAQQAITAIVPLTNEDQDAAYARLLESAASHTP